jgi:hypothetical protein
MAQASTLADPYGNDALALALLRGSPGIFRFLSERREITNENTQLLRDIYEQKESAPKEIAEILKTSEIKLDEPIRKVFQCCKYGQSIS